MEQLGVKITSAYDDGRKGNSSAKLELQRLDIKNSKYTSEGHGKNTKQRRIFGGDGLHGTQ